MEELQAVIHAIDRFQPKYVLALGDPWNFNHLQELKTHAKTALPELRFILLLNIDGSPMHTTWFPIFLAADALATTSHFGKMALEEAKTVKASFVPLGIDPTMFNTGTKAALLPPDRTQHIHRENSFTVLWVGQNTSRKDPGSFVDIMAAFLKDKEDAFAVMCSQWNSPIGTDLEAIINNHSNFPVEKLMFVSSDSKKHPSDENMRQLYSVASAIVCTALGEGFWLPGYEAQACGCVPVANNNTAIAEAVGDRGVLVEPATTVYGEYDFVRYFCDKGKILAALEALYDDWKRGGENLGAMSEAGAEWAAQMTWDNTVKALLPLFEAADRRPVYKWVQKAAPSSGPVVSVCPSYGESCGIAEYTKSLNQSLTDNGVEPLVAKTRSVADILKLVEEVKPSILHFQHEYGFWPNDSHFLDLLSELNKFNIKSVVTMHSVTMDNEYNGRLMKSPATILTHSEFMKERMEYTGVKDADVRVMPMGCFYQKKILDRDKVRERNGLSKDEFIVGSYGFLRPCKGYEELVSGIIHANGMEAGVKALIYSAPHAYGSEAYEDWFMEIVNSSGASQLVTMIRDRRPKRDVINILGCCDLIILAYKENAAGGGLSSAVKDCLVTGVPTIVTNVTAFTDIPSDVAGRIAPDDHEAITRTIVQARERPDLLEPLGVAGRKFCWDNRWGVVAEKHIELYEELEG
jgi:glycosyltransferase involved in cell wall biosynthesis